MISQDGGDARAPRDLARAVAVTLVLAGLTGSLSAAENAGEIATAIGAALAHPDRPKADRERDPHRHPAEVLSLAGVRPVMQIADLMAGSGWYTEILSRVVGPKGRIYAQNNTTSAKRHGKALARRIENSNLGNVVRLERELEELGLPTGQVDVIFMVQFYHDTYWMKVDREAMNRGIFESLKPGGVFCLIDHRAEAGSGDRDVKRLHRVDPALVKREVLAAGFVLEEESDLLSNPHDPYSISVFDPSIRGRTDRFLFMFRKPRGFSSSAPSVQPNRGRVWPPLQVP